MNVLVEDLATCTGAHSRGLGWKCRTGHHWHKIISENIDTSGIPNSVLSKKTGRDDPESKSTLVFKEYLEEKKHAEEAMNNTGQGLDRKGEITRSISNRDKSTRKARRL